MDLPIDTRTLALLLARGRVVVGVIATALPGVAAGTAPGERSPGNRAFARMLGARDVALGLGAITSLKERTQDAEWVGMGGVVDLVDGTALLLTRGLPARARLVGLIAFGAGVAGILAARALADERTSLGADAVTS
jgi:peptide-methionine (R)-S-oxide reductase